MANILVIGEDCTDVFEYGTCTRLNPEAPTPVFVSDRLVQNRGMAGNVYTNLTRICPISWQIEFFHQPAGDIVKHRFVDTASNYIILRVDKDGPLDSFRLTPDVISMIHDADIVVVSDYNKGFLSKEDLLDIACIAKVSFIDTKKPLGKWAEEFDYIKINKKEFANPEHDKDFINSNLDKIIVTKGEEGADLGKIKVMQTKRVEVKDVSGAGDTFLAGLVAKYAKTGDILESIKFANQCAGEAVSHKGVVSVDLSI